MEQLSDENQIPKHWQIKKLGEISKVKGGKRLPKGDTYSDEVTRFPYLRVTDFENLTINTKKLKYLKESTQKLIKNYIISKDDVYISIAGTIGVTGTIPAILDGANLTENAAKITELKNCYNKFISLFLTSIDGQSQIKNYTKTTTQPKLSLYRIEQIDIPLPPLPEQQAIVSKIEELLSDLENGKQQLLTAQQQLKVYRKALIMEGVTGKLTLKWRTEHPEIESSEKVFQKIQNLLDKSFKVASEEAASNGKRKPKDQRKNKRTTNVEADLPELPESWNYYRLEDITFLVTDGTHFTPKYQKTGVKFLSVKNVRPFYFREEDVKYISQEEHKSLIERCNPQKNDILYTKVGATYGYAAKVTMDYDFSIFVSLCLIKPVYKYFSSDFLEILMNSELVFKQARKRVSGSGVPDLHLIEIRDFKIPLPSLEEQLQIVEELESKLTVCDKIEETIKEALQKSETLRQSILQKAFSGQLIKNQGNHKNQINYGSDN